MALDLINRLGLYNVVFTDPDHEIPIPDTTDWNHAYNCLSVLKSNNTPGSIYHTLVRSEDAALKAWILAALAPWAKISKAKKQGGKSVNNEPYMADVARRGIKTDSKTGDLATGAFSNRIEITELKDAINLGDAWIHERVGSSRKSNIIWSPF